MTDLLNMVYCIALHLWRVACHVGYTWMRDDFYKCLQALLCTDEGGSHHWHFAHCSGNAQMRDNFIEHVQAL
eukprot:5315074-Ditylum_brightwellii.AAC.1